MFLWLAAYLGMSLTWYSQFSNVLHTAAVLLLALTLLAFPAIALVLFLNRKRHQKGPVWVFLGGAFATAATAFFWFLNHWLDYWSWQL